MNQDKVFKNLVIQSRGMVGSLTTQYILGMVINMFGSSDDSKARPILVAASFITHLINGFILPIFAISILYFAYKTGKNELKKPALYGFLGVLVATVGGISTLILGESQVAEYTSLLMATAFLFAFFHYVKLFVFLRK